MKEWFDMACIGDGFIVRGVLNNDVVTDQLSPCQVSRIFKRLTAEAGWTKTDTVMRYVERTRPPGLICEDGEELPD